LGFLLDNNLILLQFISANRMFKFFFSQTEKFAIGLNVNFLILNSSIYKLKNLIFYSYKDKISVKIDKIKIKHLKHCIFAKN
jgi:hypothetical protein